ncbi:ECF transporter S component [Fuchsiella alkaliacetigena]|uniref:ECF transporter S component n=1 Tax=Fuchsiella alkaliacetigena TaxID=957042 RepID=UPI00200A5B5A|nr:ECF transporter S component [Fuchsiella alkaliacetigena]MCK8824191.1 ECF transporter S component [Fuchsiella alkaliacetigena]
MQDNKVTFLTRTAILLALALVIQLGSFPQPVTGPLINTILYLATLLVNIWSGVAIGLFTPIVAFIQGILPPPLAPMIPFIALSNGVLAVVFGLISKQNKIVGIIVASLSKYLILAAAVTFIVEVPEQIARMMSLPQLITALAGGVIAMLVYRALVAIDFVDSSYKN